MKKLIPVLVLTALISQPAAAESKFLDYLRDYGLPCAAGLAGGLLLADSGKTGAAIGVGVCLGVGTATYLSSRKEYQLTEQDLERIRGMAEASAEERAEAKKQELAAQLQQIEAAQNGQLEELKKTLREVLADRMLKMEAEMKATVNKKLESGELMPALEKNLMKAMKSSVVTEVKAGQKEIVEQCVEQTIKEVISKPIGLPNSPSGVQDN